MRDHSSSSAFRAKRCHKFDRRVLLSWRHGKNVNEDRLLIYHHLFETIDPMSFIFQRRSTQRSRCFWRLWYPVMRGVSSKRHDEQSVLDGRYIVVVSSISGMVRNQDTCPEFIPNPNSSPSPALVPSDTPLVDNLMWKTLHDPR